MTAPLLSADTLASFRAIQDANMTSECDLIVFATTRGPGGVTDKTAVVLATVPCRLSLLASSDPLLAAQPTSEGQFTLTLPAGTDTAGVERATVRGTTKGIAWTQALRITGIDEPRTWSASRRLRAERATDTVIATPLVGSVVVSEA